MLVRIPEYNQLTKYCKQELKTLLKNFAAEFDGQYESIPFHMFYKGFKSVLEFSNKLYLTEDQKTILFSLLDSYSIEEIKTMVDEDKT